MYWVKPPWADQIPEKVFGFGVGKHMESGQMKVTCTEGYFLEDCTFAVREMLTDVHDVVVESIELNTLLTNVDEETQCTPDQQPADGSEVNLTPVNVCKRAVSEKKLESEPSSNGNGNSHECSNSKKKKPRIDHNDEKENKSNIDIDIINGKKGTVKLLSERKYLLDIDLDFFSVTNPFISDYTPSEFRIL